MMDANQFREFLKANGIDFYTGVPDSLLKSLCSCLKEHVRPENNIIAANEGAAIGLAAGYHLATGRIPVVYMQNSGLGNTVNPLLSLIDREVYNIPVLLIVGWRGEPGIKDEPQHVKQGKVTLSLLDAMGIPYCVLSDSSVEAYKQIRHAISRIKETGEVYALVVRKGTFENYISSELPQKRSDEFPLGREEAIGIVLDNLSKDISVVSTTGMISRELFELREVRGEGHGYDFLTVGSMGHASQIALGIALNKPDKIICCFDGDGATIMHMGSLAIVGQRAPRNYIHIVFNNGAHDSVGGQPTVGLDIDIPEIAKACGYKTFHSAEDKNGIEKALNQTNEYPMLLEIKVHRGARRNLGRPTTTPLQNKEAFMKHLDED